MNKDAKVLELDHHYDPNFKPTQEYLDSMPDLQNGEFDDEPIDFVGIQNFHLPIRIREKGGGTQEVRAAITGTVSLEAENRGINMSRIIRTFYKSKDKVFNINELESVLRDYQRDLKSFDAHILMNFDYRIWQDALRSTHTEKMEDHQGYYEQEVKDGGWQYYNITFDVNLDKSGEFKRILWMDYVYSSACPCSTELTIHNAVQRGKFGIPHSQRSVARIGIEFANDDTIWIEDLLKMCREAIPTETLVFCKRIDEQAFSELNGANPIFVEDAIRKLKHTLNEDSRIRDFKIVCLHAESLHSHSAISITTKGVKPTIFKHHVTLGELKDIANSIH